VSRPTWGSRSPRVSFRLRGFHPLWPDFPDRFSYESLVLPRPLNPAALTCDGLASSAFARHYLRNHYCFLFLRVLRCFTSPGSPPTPMDSALDNAELPALGFPIRRSPDQSLVDGSPRLIAATHVLHRLSAPRHPPHALSSLVTRSSFSRNAAVWCGSRPRSRSTSTWTRACSRMRYSISKLSVPSFVCGFQRASRANCLEKIVELNGIEPMTSCLQSRCSTN
jgi:hypothetical protein